MYRTSLNQINQQNIFAPLPSALHHDLSLKQRPNYSNYFPSADPLHKRSKSIVMNLLSILFLFSWQSPQKQKMTSCHIRELWVSYLVEKPAKLHCIWCACSQISGVCAVLRKHNTSETRALSIGPVITASFKYSDDICCV